LGDPKVAAKLKAEFVTTGTGVETLASLNPSVIGWFGTMAAAAFKKAGLEKYLEQYKTVQGMYVAGPDGTPYALLQSDTPDGVLKELDAALAAYRASPPPPVEIPDAAIRAGAPAGPPRSVSVIRLYYRCTPMPKGADPINASIGRDHLWIFPDEVRELVKTTALPRRVAARLVRFHLVDNVRGLADSWNADDVQRADFAVQLVGPKTYALSGQFAAGNQYPGDLNYKGPRGVEGKLQAEFVVEGDRIVRFRGVVEATAWGAGTNTWGQPKGRFPLVIAMIETDDPVSRAVGPVWREWGLDYQNPATK
jgi:hypothetical protein